MSKNDPAKLPSSAAAGSKPATLHPGVPDPHDPNTATIYGANGAQPNTAPPIPINDQQTFIKPEGVLKAAGVLDAEVNVATAYLPATSAAPNTAPKVIVAADAEVNVATAYMPATSAAPPVPRPAVPPAQASRPATQQPAAKAAPTGPTPVGQRATAVAQAALQVDGATILPEQAKSVLSSAPSAKKPNTQKPTDAPEGTQLVEGEEDVDLEDAAAKPPPQPAAGDHVNHYELIRELGKGGMGSVFLARDNKLGRRVAIKFLHTQHPELTQRFILEARTTARFSHENIVIIYEVDQHRGQPYMVLEFLQGQPLTKLIADGKPMPPPRAVELMIPVVRALASAHEQNIVHRDLKFDNVFVTDSGLIKVLDFGIAKVLGSEDRTLEAAEEKKSKKKTEDTQTTHKTGYEESTDLTRHGTIMGTLAFMSPEQWGKGGPIDNRTDIWAAGIMLFRMLTGKHPLSPLTGMALAVTGRLDEPMPKLRDFNPDVPAELAAVVDRCLLKKKDERWPDALSMLRALEPFMPGRFTRGEIKIDESPYAGLASFQEADADRFFGRSKEIAALVNRIQDVPLIGVVGPSGTGKSSFVRAGLVPSLKRSGEQWETLVIRPGRSPLQALANIVAPLVSTSTSIADDLQALEKLTQRLVSEPGYVGSVLRSRARRENKNILVFVDQFEELYTLVPDAKERLAFTASLSSIADDATSPTRVVLSIRSDFLDRVPEDQGFMNELTKGLFFLTPPADDGLRDALVQPAEMAGYRFETTDIVEDMLSHLASTQGALPLLQFAASKLWENRDPSRKMLTRASYDRLGGIAGALAAHADAVLNEMSPQARGLVRSIFLRCVTPDRTRAIVSLDDLRELSKERVEVQRVIDQLVQARLLVVQTGGGASGATVEIVHESLIHTWPQLKRWLDESGEDSVFLEQLRNAAKQWQAKGKSADLLWRGEVVEEAHRFQRRFRGELPEVQRQFLDAVFRHEKRAARRKRMLAASGITFLVALVIAAGVALVIIGQAQREATRQAKVAQEAEVLARKAETEAKLSLEEVKAKEHERAEAAKRAEEARAAAEKAAAEVQQKAVELAKALNEAQQAQKLAYAQRIIAMKHAEEARRAQALATQKAAEAKQLADAEAERARMLEKQLGSPVIDTLR